MRDLARARKNFITVRPPLIAPLTSPLRPAKLAVVQSRANALQRSDSNGHLCARVLLELSEDCSVRCFCPTIYLKRTPLYSQPIFALMLLAMMSTTLGCGKNRPVAQWNDKVLAVGRAHDAGKTDQAERDYLRLLQNPPSEDARRYILTELAEISRQRGDWDQALRSE